MTIPFIKYSKVWFAISIITTIVAVGAVMAWGLKFGIDFTGGSLIELSFSKNRPSTEQIKQTLSSEGLKEGIVQGSGEDRLIVRTNFVTEEQHQKLIQKIQTEYGKDGNNVKEERFETIGSAVSDQLRKRALASILWVNVAIILYVAYAFRKVSRPVASWKYGALAIVALFHDIMVVIGVFAFLGKFAGVEVETDFVLALLTVLGFSVTDTIVVYDRVRENLVRHSANDFPGIVNLALNETLMRSINTTLTVLLPLFALYFLGGSTIHNFALALLVGMASGTYSSIFIASPLLVYVEKWQRRKLAVA